MPWVGGIYSNFRLPGCSADFTPRSRQFFAEVMFPETNRPYTHFAQITINFPVASTILFDLLCPVDLVVLGHDEVPGTFVEKAAICKHGQAQFGQPPVRLSWQIERPLDQSGVGKQKPKQFPQPPLGCSPRTADAGHVVTALLPGVAVWHAADTDQVLSAASAVVSGRVGKSGSSS